MGWLIDLICYLKRRKESITLWPIFQKLCLQFPFQKFCTYGVLGGLFLITLGPNITKMKLQKYYPKFSYNRTYPY